jgi:hypothetical protein
LLCYIHMKNFNSFHIILGSDRVSRSLPALLIGNLNGHSAIVICRIGLVRLPLGRDSPDEP